MSKTLAAQVALLHQLCTCQHTVDQPSRLKALVQYSEQKKWLVRTNGEVTIDLIGILAAMAGSNHDLCSLVFREWEMAGS